jgi:Spy/CpxP family protein refolding chaperone
MKKTLLTVLSVLLVAALASFGLSRWMQCAKPAPSLDVLQDVSWLSRKLDLTTRQAQEIRKLQEELRAKLESCDSMNCSARCQLGNVLFRGTNGSAQASTAVETMCGAQAEAERATLDHIRKVHQLLTPDQQKRYEELVVGCVCPTCPHHPPHGRKT